jgi:hypothetical protein
MDLVITEDEKLNDLIWEVEEILGHAKYYLDRKENPVIKARHFERLANALEEYKKAQKK